MFVKLIVFLPLMFLVLETYGKPTIYKRNEVTNIYEQVMVPVSSTVIPLPVYKVGYGFGFISKDKKSQASFKPDGAVKLITAKSAQEAQEKI